MDQVDKLILQIQGQEKVKELKAELDLWDTALRKINEELKLGTITQAQFDAQAKTLATTMVRLNGEIAKLEKESGMARAGGLLQLQYILDDLSNTSGSWERKLASISNNIPGLVLGLGGSQGIAGAIGIVSTALIALAPVATAAWQALGGGGGGPEPVVKALETAEEKLKRVRAELERLLKAATPEAEGTAKLVKAALEGRGGDVLGGLAGTLEASGQGAQFTADEARTVEGLERTIRDAQRVGAPPNPGAQARLNALRQQLRQRNMDMAAGLMTEATGTGPGAAGARARLRQLIRANPGAFPAGLESDLADSEPDVQDAFDREVRDQAADAEAAHERRLERERKANQAERDRQRLGAALQRRTQRDIAAMDEQERLKEQQLRAVERHDAERTKEDLEREALAPRFRAQRDVTALSEQIARNTNGQMGGTPTADQAEAMARDVLRLQQGGLGHEQAVWMSVYRMLQQIQRNQAQANAAMSQQMQMFGGAGPDMGQFAFPWGGW